MLRVQSVLHRFNLYYVGFACYQLLRSFYTVLQLMPFFGVYIQIHIMM